MFRGAFLNLKAYIYRKKTTNSLELNLLEYQQSIYLKEMSSSPREGKVLKAIVDHRETYEYFYIK